METEGSNDHEELEGDGPRRRRSEGDIGITGRFVRALRRLSRPCMNVVFAYMYVVPHSVFEIEMERLLDKKCLREFHLVMKRVYAVPKYDRLVVGRTPEEFEELLLTTSVHDLDNDSLLLDEDDEASTSSNGGASVDELYSRAIEYIKRNTESA